MVTLVIKMKALLMGYYGGRNLGDEMMLFCLQRWLGAQNVDLTVLSERARDVRERHGLETIENVPLLGQWAWRDAWLRGKAPRLLRAIARHDALIVGGGDLIRDDRGGSRSFFFAVEKIVVAILLGRPVYLVNIGIGAPTTWYGRLALKWALPRCTRIIARDARTLDFCRQMGAGAVTEYAPDIVLSLPRLLDRDVTQPGDGGNYAVVCLRTEANVFKQFAWTDRRIQTLARGLDHLIDERNLDIVFVPFQALTADQDDSRIHRLVAACMQRRERVTVREWTDDFRDVAGLVRGAQFVIAMRLHAAVLACSLDRPCILMPYDYKVAEFGRQMGLRYSITPGTLESVTMLDHTLEAALGDTGNRPWRVPTSSWHQV
jgi:polysaccharide pyruvyl transferase CsaB